MHRILWADSRSRSSFLLEIHHASQAIHPGIVRYLGWGQSPHGGPYLICEFIDGQPLTKVNIGDLNACVDWLKQICLAISAAHRLGVVHGDLSPNNIMLENSGRVVVTDFGFAKIMANTHSETNSDVELPEARILGGTLGFAAPEQVSTAFGRIGPATDIYAIGGLAYFLLTGRSPNCSIDLMETISEDETAMPETDASIAASKLATVARLALKKAIVNRPQSMMDLISILD